MTTDVRQVELSSQQWRAFRTRLDSILLSSKFLPIDEARKQCQLLDDMNLEQRQAHIRKYWGEVCADKAHPVLVQLASLESKWTSPVQAAAKEAPEEVPVKPAKKSAKKKKKKN